MTTIRSHRRRALGWDLLKKRESQLILLVAAFLVLCLLRQSVQVSSSSSSSFFWEEASILSEPTTESAAAKAAIPISTPKSSDTKKKIETLASSKTTTTTAPALVSTQSTLTQPTKSTNLPELERKFYEHHANQTKAIPKSDMLLWEARDKWRSFWKYLEGNYYVFQRDTDGKASPTADNPIPANTAKHRLLHYRDYIGVCQAAQVMHRFHQQFPDSSFPHISIVHLQEDMGGLSQSYPGVTTPRYDLVKKWKREGNCKQSFVVDYLNHPDTLAVLTSQHQILSHPKAHSLPLGLRFAYTVDTAYETLHSSSSVDYTKRRPKIMMVNSRTKNRAARAMVQAKVLRQFAGLGIQNTFGNPKRVGGYFDEMLNSTFIFSPAGAGWDCYRNWEALYMGTIPIIEHKNRQDGWYRTFHGLPVAWIDSYDRLTPKWLEEKYQEILVAGAESYQWEKLTRQYWINFVGTILKDAGFELIQVAPPPTAVMENDNQKKGNLKKRKNKDDTTEEARR